MVDSTEQTGFVEWGTNVFGIWYKHERPHDLWPLGDQVHLEWKDECPDNIAEERFHFDTLTQNQPRPSNWNEIHIWLLERGFFVTSMDEEFEWELDKKWESASDYPWRLVDGQFGYNEHNVCVYGEINICSINIERGKVYANAEMGKASHGWAIGLSIGNTFEHCGSGGSSHGIWYNARYQYRTKEDASAAALHMILRDFQKEHDKAPEKAKKTFQKAIDVVRAQLGGAPEPRDFDILNPNDQDEAEINEISTAPVMVSTKQPLQYQLF